MNPGCLLLDLIGFKANDFEILAGELPEAFFNAAGAETANRRLGGITILDFGGEDVLPTHGQDLLVIET